MFQRTRKKTKRSLTSHRSLLSTSTHLRCQLLSTVARKERSWQLHKTTTSFRSLRVSKWSWRIASRSRMTWVKMRRSSRSNWRNLERKPTIRMKTMASFPFSRSQVSASETKVNSLQSRELYLIRSARSCLVVLTAGMTWMCSKSERPISRD